MNTLRLLRLGVLGVLGCCAAAAVDRYLPAPTFCQTGSGCEAVRQGQFGAALGALLPALGLVAYSFIYWGSMRPGALRRAALLLATAGGLGGGSLLLFQWLGVGVFCPLCVVTDGLAVLTGLVGVLALRKATQGVAAPTTWPLPAWGALYAFALLAPPAVALSKPSPLPEYVRRLHVPGKINVVEVSDFQCPHCRRLHGPLSDVIAPHGDRVHFVRLPYPLPGHRHGRGAALMYLCAQQLGRGEAAADALFRADLAKMGPEQLARTVGIPPQALATCLADPETTAGLESAMKAVAQGGFRGLPTVYIGHQTLLGYDHSAGKAPYEAAIAGVAEGKGTTYAPWPWLALGAVMLWLVTASARTARRQRTA